MKSGNKINWVSSQEAMKIAKIESCDLMHHRVAGKLEFEKRENAFFYDKKSIENIKK